MDELNALYPCRNEELQTIDKLINQPYNLNQFLYIWGGTSTGKTSIIQSYVDTVYTGISCYIDLIECYQLNLLLERILFSFLDKQVKCSKMNEFLEWMKELQEDKNYLVVLDNSSRIKNFNWQLLPTLLKVKEKLNINLSIILINTQPYDSIRLSMSHKEPFEIHFKSYNKKQIYIILNSKKGLYYNKELTLEQNQMLLKGYLNAFIDATYHESNQVNLLLELSLKYFENFIQPVIDEEEHCNNTPGLYMRVQTLIQEMLKSTLYKKPIDNQALIQLEPIQHIPNFGKYLLIASYLASHNPSKTDMHMFYKGTDSKRLKVGKNKKQISVDLRGPKAFPMERLMAIFYTILDIKIMDSYHINSMISTLISHHMLSLVGSYGKLENIKLRCEIGLNQIISLSKSLNFKLEDYLYFEY